jgi:hypothetical protein
VSAFHEKLDEHLGKQRTILEEAYRRDQANASASPAQDTVTIEGKVYKTWTWNGKIRAVPSDWSFPRAKVKVICDLFMYGMQMQSNLFD